MASSFRTLLPTARSAARLQPRAAPLRTLSTAPHLQGSSHASTSRHQLSSTVPHQSLRRTRQHAANFSSSSRAFAAASETQKACPTCHAANPPEALVCQDAKCGALQVVPPGVSPWQLLGVERGAAHGWQVDLPALKQAWRKCMGAAHPDRARNGGEHQIRLAEAQSSALNKAYETLRSPLLRAHWLLEDLGADVPAEDEGVDDAELLMEVMELREALDEASSSEAVDEVREQNEAHIERTIQQLGEAFAAEPVDIQAAREGSVRLRYWLNIEKAAKERLD
ncbi:hypothetical protein FA09DRAFT_332807 [Tilletiopsis washingtonensis]|uniref:J domain-containing protein n=1 Tax=Tilletiopsis washingtonensis TaxID=58919 RepID=A0A316YYZ9_9BASI|nr:hypothetical protein FA09DRAFT_332807 [Tilletiopsis washingtonensis]PWN94690.1 hypothetical protein FA09DRAFT_332807 [Tilletiopsis washingtonensis]